MPTYACIHCAAQHAEAGNCANCGGRTELADDGPTAAASEPAFAGAGISGEGPGGLPRTASVVAMGGALSIVAALILIGMRFLESGTEATGARPDAAPTAGAATPDARPEVAADRVNSLNAMAMGAGPAAMRPYVHQAQLSQVLASVTPIRMLVMEYQAMNGKFPREVAQLNLDVGELIAGEYVDGVRLGEDGRIVVALSELFGEDQRLALVPEDTMGGMRMKWNCRTTLQAADLGVQNRNPCATVSDPDF